MRGYGRWSIIAGELLRSFTVAVSIECSFVFGDHWFSWGVTCENICFRRVSGHLARTASPVRGTNILGKGTDRCARRSRRRTSASGLELLRLRRTELYLRSQWSEVTWR